MLQIVSYTPAYLLLHLTLASSEWAQLWTPTPLLGQSQSLFSEPVQPTLSSKIGPVPWPKNAKDRAVAPNKDGEKCKHIKNKTKQKKNRWRLSRCNVQCQYIPVEENPSCLQATCASVVPHESSHTVPHWLLLQTSTRPSRAFVPPTSLMSPVAQTARKYLVIQHKCAVVSLSAS